MKVSGKKNEPICLQYWLLIVFLMMVNVAKTQNTVSEKAFWKQVRKEIPEFRKVFRKYKKYRFEIVYTRVVHQPAGDKIYLRYHYGDEQHYFYPASTVKFPLALRTFMELEKLVGDTALSTENICITPSDSVFCGQTDFSYRAHRYMRLKDSMSVQNAAAMGGMNRETFCNINHTDPFRKIPAGTIVRLTTNPEPLTLNEMMNDMLIYSNNHYFNWLFEFTGGAYFKDISVHKRLMYCNSSDSLRTRKLHVLQGDSPALALHSKNIRYPARYKDRSAFVGKKYYDGNGRLIHHGRDFSNHNRVQLASMQDLLIGLVYPDYSHDISFPRINGEHRRNLIRYMGLCPSEDQTVTDSNYLYVNDDITNFLYTGQSHQPLPEGLRIVNVIGQAYGFATDCAYFADEKNKIDFFLAVRIYVNKNETLNDDKYEYAEIAFPLMEKLGKVIHRLTLNSQQGSEGLSPVFQIWR